ncbi:Dyp-type peroxidase [Burkholderia ubonensis]|uniref:Dyp-type peroxidase n=1 Tax=Burkholderia ubonensis TaxID=101571 RepID=UPI00075AA744|nr:Dyp-type peroxidase [Burkholderia ubonensis]KVT31711.1 hypothetical protein WK51_26360 [Burkholderia ubonensis]
MKNQEPLLDLDDIQGNVFPGFSKDHQTLRFLSIAEIGPARALLSDLILDVTTSAMVRDYGLLRKQIKTRRRGGPSGLTSTWINISLGYSGLARLASASIADSIDGGGFKAGLAARSAILGDPLDPAKSGHATQWRIGAPGSPAIDVVITVAGDRREDVDSYLLALDDRFGKHCGADGLPALRKLLPDLEGDTLGGDLNGHEHFGFKDGISQPGILGRLKSDPSTYVVPRILDSASLDANRYGRPGQILLQPGQLLLGQPRQNGIDRTKPLDPVHLQAEWLRNGSFMVLRQLEQDVPAFWAQMRAYARALVGLEDDDTVDWVASRIVGRWRSGAPILRTPDKDDPRFMSDDRVSNDFAFRNTNDHPPLLAAGQPPLPALPLAMPDPEGNICPFAAHIRKVNPRDDSVELGSPDETLVHMIARRGIPYGPALPDPRHATPDEIERGLVFVSYQASIERQFEFLMQNWVNGDDAPHVGAGRDAVLGRHAPQGQVGSTQLTMFDKGGNAHTLPQLGDFITPHGGGYFFTPSLAGLRHLATAQPAA